MANTTSLSSATIRDVPLILLPPFLSASVMQNNHGFIVSPLSLEMLVEPMISVSDDKETPVHHARTSIAMTAWSANSGAA
jgi:hypothetical protein